MDTHRFTCLACHVAFATADQQRAHYRTDWHRYNLKRKVAELPPVPAEEFAHRVLARQAQDKADQESAALSFTCNLCNKTYANENGYRNHVQSKKHKERAIAADLGDDNPDALLTRQPKKQLSQTVVTPATSATPISPAPASTDAAGAAVATSDVPMSEAEHLDALADQKIKSAVKLEPTDCLFCPRKSESMDLNLDHMTTAHSFFIPDIDYLVDLPGLLAYLAEKLTVGNACLWCYSPYHASHTPQTTRGLFKSLDDVRRHMADKGHCKIQYEDGADLEIADFYDFASTWEGVDAQGAEGDADAEVGADGNGMFVDAESSQLVLPSGKALGHRDYRRYFRQNIRDRSAEEVTTISHLVDKYKQLGVYADLVQREERRTARDIERRRHYYQMGLGVRANKLQTHFRPQVMF
ncbi:hypothetical protein AMAG_01929 [Allomyces macrogynus ATCC 38327]|uniref:C2H2-type domain-containing protein n=1 Tax=Allomyces macrogynus (strain ATCC 38327) TaxID=578462 RepID=A0A0L0S0D5_ALLM3|nr:hypothetical protein AMAG_01929 [Allomyces macrogynus ATCC 38327]|eukprot:KNE56087.1 hypothetical protein AMAG_01929 [Allomyces macrogynus ATCC 38327]